MPLDLDSFGDHQRLFKVNAKVSDGTVHLGMAQSQLDGPKVARFLADLGDLRSPHLMCAVGAGVQADGR
jgi:hypothetical protein